MLDLAEQQTLQNMATNIIVAKGNGAVLSEDEYLYYKSILQTLTANNELKLAYVQHKKSELERVIGDYKKARREAKNLSGVQKELDLAIKNTKGESRRTDDEAISGVGEP